MRGVTRLDSPSVHGPEYDDSKPLRAVAGLVHDYRGKLLVERMPDLPPAERLVDPVFGRLGELHIIHTGEAVTTVGNKLLPRESQGRVIIKDWRLLKIADNEQLRLTAGLRRDRISGGWLHPCGFTSGDAEYT